MEHLAATDRGVTMFRKQIRSGIRAVRTGHDPAGLCREEGKLIPTYCNDTIVRVPPARSETADNQMMRDTGRRLAESYLKEPPLAAGR